MKIHAIGYNPKKIVDKAKQMRRTHKGITPLARQSVIGIAFYADWLKYQVKVRLK
jgi:hypothetical protein